MSHSEAPSKKLKVLALSETDRDVFMGSIIYRTGLELPVLEQLEKANKTRYQDIVPFMHDKDLEPTFYTPKHCCTFIEGCRTWIGTLKSTTTRKLA